MDLTNFGLKIQRVLDNLYTTSMFFNIILNGLKRNIFINSTLCFVIVLVSANCVQNRNIQIDQQDVLRFGHGGGVLGKEYVFFLKRDGSISGLDTKPIRLNSNQLKQVSKNIEFFKLRSNSFNQPGNLYRFIELENENHLWSRIVWDANDPNAPKELRLFYNYIYHFLKT